MPPSNVNANNFFKPFLSSARASTIKWAHTTLWIGLLIGLFHSTNTHAATLTHYDYKVIKTLPHPPHIFTQGLDIENKTFWESSGLYGKSFIRKADLTNGETLLQRPLPEHLFAEGIALFNDYLYGFSWKAGIAYRWHKNTLALDKSYTYTGEGWGMSRWQETLITSDGSSMISVRNPENFKVIKQLTVTMNKQPISSLNDLTHSDTHLWANVWFQNRILEIRPDNGQVTGVLDLTNLALEHQPRLHDAVLNGIAWDPKENGLWVTGKYWNKLFLLRLSPQ